MPLAKRIGIVVVERQRLGGAAEGVTAWFGDPCTMRWVLIHMLEETARHAGPVDILREMIDGVAGDHRRN